MQKIGNCWTIRMYPPQWYLPPGDLVIFGYNTEIRLGDTIYHVQSEAQDSERLLQSQVFVKGHCISKRSTPSERGERSAIRAGILASAAPLRGGAHSRRAVRVGAGGISKKFNRCRFGGNCRPGFQLAVYKRET